MNDCGVDTLCDCNCYLGSKYTSKSPLTLDITISIACYQSDTVALVAPARALIEFSRQKSSSQESVGISLIDFTVEEVLIVEFHDGTIIKVIQHYIEIGI